MKQLEKWLFEDLNVFYILLIIGLYLTVISVYVLSNYKKNSTVNKIERHCNLVNDGETGCQIKQVKANGFNSAYSNTGSNSVFVGSREAE